MTENQLIQKVLSVKCDTSNIEFKAAKQGCPETLYDTLSSFSYTNGGVKIFGIDEKNEYKVEGVGDVQNFQKKITEQSLSMEPDMPPQR